jgi:hypothetical protein
LFTNAQKNAGDQVASTNVNVNNFKLWSQYWTETTYTDESNYDVKTRSVPDRAFLVWYRDVISDLTQAKATLAEESVLPGTEQEVANKNAIIELMIVFAYQRLVDLFGNVPYSQAMDIENNLQPAYDDAWTIYQDLAARVDAAIASMDPSAGSFGASDLMYGGDVANWIAFGHGLKLKMGLTISDFNSGVATSWISNAAPNVFTSNAQNCVLSYLGATPNTNPLYVDLVLSGRQDFIAGKTIADTMNFYNDNRRAQYFTTDPNGNYSGGAIGESNPYVDFSKPGDKLVDPTLPVVLMSYDEMEFYLAEAAERGFISGSAQSHYENAINASYEMWGAGDASAYLAQTDVAWGTGTHSNLEKIARESWVAFYNRGFVAWTQIRRMDFPLPLAAAPQDGVYPVRYTYPVNEQTLNGANYTSAASTIGGDLSSTHIFWDVD